MSRSASKGTGWRAHNSSTTHYGRGTGMIIVLRFLKSKHGGMASMTLGAQDLWRAIITICLLLLRYFVFLLDSACLENNSVVSLLSPSHLVCNASPEFVRRH
jgi:hypothetical protein